MGRKKKYESVAAKQRAWRIRSGKQKQKVPLEIRRGQPLGSSEVELRLRKEGESWQEYHKYIETSVDRARRRQAHAGGAAGRVREKLPGGVRQRERRDSSPDETVFEEDYYELRAKYEKDLYELEQKRRRKIGEKK